MLCCLPCFWGGQPDFPPFLGQNAGENTLPAMVGFLATAVVLPVLGVVVVARFDGLEKLGNQVGARFALVFTVLIYLSIGPGLGIPRAASVPFEMAVAPYLPEGSNPALWMAAYSLGFFLIALWLCLNPGKLVDRIGRGLTPALLALLTLLFVSFLFRGETSVAAAQGGYQEAALLKGFTEGYNTMDTIAALNFGLVISTTLGTFGLTEKKDKMRYTILAGVLAGTILAVVYAMLSYMGMCSSGVYPVQENGAWTLRCIVYQVFGGTGAVLLAAIFTLACLTTCVGLINSISQYFSTLSGNLLSGVGVYHHVFFVPRVQSGAEHDPEHVHPHPECHLSRIHCADFAGTESRSVEGEPVRLSHDGGGNRRGEHCLCAGRRGTAAGRSGAAAAQAAAVPAGLRLGLRGGWNAAAQLWGERSAPQGARGGGMRDPMTAGVDREGNRRYNGRNLQK